MRSHPAVELLSSYLDREVTPAELRRLEGHLTACDECRRRVEGLRGVAAGLKRLETVAPPPTLSAAVERRVRLAELEGTRGTGPSSDWWRWLNSQPVLAPAFATVLALAAILYLFSFGVAKRAQKGTRVVVASAPAEEDEAVIGQLSPRRSEPPELEVASAGRSGHPAAADEVVDEVERLEEVTRSAVGGVPAATSSEATGSEAIPGEEAEPGLRTSAPARELRPAKPEATAERVAIAGESVVQRGAIESLADREAAIRLLAGRRFVRTADLWIEVGLEGREADEIVDLRRRSRDFDSEWAPFHDLDRVRLRMDGRVVEVIYRSAPPED